MTKTHPEFNDRPSALRIFFLGKDKAHVACGDTVTLRLSEVSVIFRGVNTPGADRYSRPYYEGYSEGDEVEFTERKIFGCQ